VPGSPLVLCSVHSSIIWTLASFDFFAIILFAMNFLGCKSKHFY
jgi:hypothetical protein